MGNLEAFSYTVLVACGVSMLLFSIRLFWHGSCTMRALCANLITAANTSH